MGDTPQCHTALDGVGEVCVVCGSQGVKGAWEDTPRILAES